MFTPNCNNVAFNTKMLKEKKRKKPRVGGGEETRSGTEKQFSNNLQGGHPAWWSAGNWCFSHTKYFDRS